MKKGFAHCDWLRFDTALHALLGIAHFLANDPILRFFARFSQGYIESIFRPLAPWLLALFNLKTAVGGTQSAAVIGNTRL